MTKEGAAALPEPTRQGHDLDRLEVERDAQREATDPGRGGSDRGAGGGGLGALEPPVEILGQRGPDYLHSEVELAEASGIAVKILREARKNLPEKMWAVVEGHVRYCREGLEAVLASVTAAPLSPELIGELAERTAPAPGEGTGPTDTRGTDPERPEKIGRVVRFYLNPRLFQVEFDDGSRGDVRVRSVENFRAGMEVPVRVIDPARPNVYELTRRAPRFPGRW